MNENASSPEHPRKSESPAPICPRCSRYGRPKIGWSAQDFRECGSCGLIFRYPFPSIHDVATRYEVVWAAPDPSVGTVNGTAAIADNMVDCLLRALRKPDLSNTRVIDFGAGRGAMLAVLEQRGAQVLAVEAFGYEYLTSRGKAAYRRLNDIPPELSFDGAVSIEVVEHLLEIRSTLADLYRRLLPGSWLLVTTPNGGGLMARLLGSRWGEAKKPNHVIFFTPKTLKSTLAEAGFGRIVRPFWFIRYPSQSKLRSFVQLVLQATRLEGQLKMIAWKD
jgi:2-polyprenyl-3-methyl-5-hydroxy-6-metoxy-1,4-benzoquinol methylase